MVFQAINVLVCSSAFLGLYTLFLNICIAVCSSASPVQINQSTNQTSIEPISPAMCSLSAWTWSASRLQYPSMDIPVCFYRQRAPCAPQPALCMCAHYSALSDSWECGSLPLSPCLIITLKLTLKVTFTLKWTTRHSKLITGISKQSGGCVVVVTSGKPDMYSAHSPHRANFIGERKNVLGSNKLAAGLRVVEQANLEWENAYIHIHQNTLHGLLRTLRNNQHSLHTYGLALVSLPLEYG